MGTKRPKYENNVAANVAVRVDENATTVISDPGYNPARLSSCFHFSLALEKWARCLEASGQHLDFKLWPPK